MVPILIGACVGCLAVGQAFRRGPRGRRRRPFFGFGRRRRVAPPVVYQPFRFGYEEQVHMRQLARQYAHLFCRAHPPCTRPRILGDVWARGYVARQVAVAMTGANGGERFEAIADYVSTHLGRLL